MLFFRLKHVVLTFRNFTATNPNIFCLFVSHVVLMGFLKLSVLIGPICLGVKVFMGNEILHPKVKPWTSVS